MEEEKMLWVYCPLVPSEHTPSLIRDFLTETRDSFEPTKRRKRAPVPAAALARIAVRLRGAFFRFWSLVDEVRTVPISIAHRTRIVYGS